MSSKNNRRALVDGFCSFGKDMSDQLGVTFNQRCKAVLVNVKGRETIGMKNFPPQVFFFFFVTSTIGVEERSIRFNPKISSAKINTF